MDEIEAPAPPRGEEDGQDPGRRYGPSRRKGLVFGLAVALVLVASTICVVAVMRRKPSAMTICQALAREGVAEACDSRSAQPVKGSLPPVEFEVPGGPSEKGLVLRPVDDDAFVVLVAAQSDDRVVIGRGDKLAIVILPAGVPPDTAERVRSILFR